MLAPRAWWLQAAQFCCTSRSVHNCSNEAKSNREVWQIRAPKSAQRGREKGVWRMEKKRNPKKQGEKDLMRVNRKDAVPWRLA